MAVVFVASINVPTAYFLVVCVWCSVGAVNVVVMLLSFSLGFCTFGVVVLLLGV